MDKQLKLPFEENKSKLLRDLEKASEKIISNEINNRNARFMVVSPQVASVINMLPDFKGKIYEKENKE